jgi:hypothetical protein
MVSRRSMSDRNSMRLFWIVVLITAGVVSASIFGLSTLTQAHPTAEGVDEQFGLELTMTLEKTVYTLGEPINITLTITNIGNQAITYDYSELGHRFDFRVYNGTNNTIYTWSNDFAFPQALDHISLNPGESLTVGQVAGPNHYSTGYYIWDQTCNNLPVSSPVNLAQVDVGTYFIVGETGSIMVESHGNFLPLGVIETTPIQVTIVKQ